ncbi:hypothetical protein B0H34DRAFT_302165 [Crassisporium funariophilum]|nr:hypothetical protein B0H34DRAFT_302165 [Crassisporium funariophilum]
MPECHHRSTSRVSSEPPNPPRSPSPPSQTYHPSILPRSVPTPALLESVAGGAHYSGIRVDSDTALKHRRSSSQQHHTDLKEYQGRILEDLTELYCCRPTLEIFERSWSKDAEFEDPLCKCKGFDEYAAQWFAMPKLFSHSKQISKRVMSSTHSPSRLIYYQTQEYTSRLLNKKKIIESIIVVELDDNGKITRLIDQWSGKDLPTWFGATFLRTLNAKVLPWLIHVPKPST